ncbi:MAG: mechanosensitive ion channel [Boseongicola sp. SB0662_bin_57]|nr:mechanosensitive ion channel [Boseongicola sp. SB0662_bin_57]
MDEVINRLNLPEFRAGLEEWFATHVLSADNATQAGLILLALLLGQLLGPRLRRAISAASVLGARHAELQGFVGRLSALSTQIVVLVFLWIAVEAGAQTQLFGHRLTQIAASLAGAWVAIRLASGFISNDLVARSVAWTAWILAALVALGLFDATVTLLDGIGMTFGEVRISLLAIAKGTLALVVLLWTMLVLSNLLERQIRRSDNLTPTVQVLISKIVKIVLVTFAFLVAVGSLGIDLTALTVFGGALGIGVGIGLQKIVSNLISGLLLLMDKSIKPNDVIAVGNTYGWVASLGARYAAVRTRDGVEYLIPNEELITQRVENWSHSDSAVRLCVPVGISYECDVRLAMDLCREASAGVERVLADPPPRCLLRSFGESSVDLEIRIWINDPAKGRANVISELLLRVWDLFHEHGIQFPFPQRDLHLKSSDIRLPSGISNQAP